MLRPKLLYLFVCDLYTSIHVHVYYVATHIKEKFKYTHMSYVLHQEKSRNDPVLCLLTRGNIACNVLKAVYLTFKHLIR